MKIKEKLQELGINKQIHELVTSKVVIQPTAAPKPGKAPVSKEEAIAQLKAFLSLLCFVALYLPTKGI